jgi:hypothetical protein
MSYLGPRVLANFKPPKSARIKAKLAKPKEKREGRDGNDADHLAAIRKCVCTVCGKVGGNDPHHLKQNTGERGAGMRSTDKWAVPLCRPHHDEIERIGSRNETRWFADHGVGSPIDLAAALWAASPDVAKMTAIVLAHRKAKA